MRLRPGPGIGWFLAACVLGAGAWAAVRSGLWDKAFPAQRPEPRVTAGDFPAGVSAPVGGYASLPDRPVRIGFTPRGSSAALLLATGGVGATPAQRKAALYGTSYALDAEAVAFSREEDLRQSLLSGGDSGGVDMAAVGVDRLAAWWPALRDAAPRTVLLLGRSRGHEALAAVGAGALSELRGQRVGVYRHGSASYFLLWALSRAGLSTADLVRVDLPSTLEAGAWLRQGKVDAVVGLAPDVAAAAQARGGTVLASTADAPHLLATVLVVRGEFSARFPDAVRRVLRGQLEAAALVNRDAAAGARLLVETAPYLGDPAGAVATAPPADLKENLSFFGLQGEAPVTYDELYESASALYEKLSPGGRASAAEDTRELGPLKYVAGTAGPGLAGRRE
jgi:ABC-type nitrate/sulfonate/bicarbonate transport system substrate-binding protein